MASQTLIPVVLPNGVTAHNTLKASIFLSFRLDKGATLAAFPDVLHWPDLVQKHGLKFEFACGTKNVTVPAVTSLLRPDAWSEIFKPHTFVEAYKLPDYDRRVIVSYPARDALSYLKYAYQVVGTGRSVGDFQRGVWRVVQSLAFRDGQKSTLDDELSQLRLQLWKDQQQVTSVGVPQIPGFVAQPKILSAPPDGVPPTLTEPLNTRDTVTRFALFHHMPQSNHSPALPSSEAEFAKTLDFHRAITALGSYPSLLRAFGLVFDVELPATFCANSPASGAYGSISLARIIPGFKWSIAPTVSFPSTAYVRNHTSFYAAPATVPTSVNSKNYLPGDIIDGLLALSPDNFNLLQTDLDGSLLKALTLADNAANATNSSVVGDALPSLRSSGVALIANGRGAQLLDSIRDNKAFDQALTTGASYHRPFVARDLARGFRIDIWSARTRQWHSLHDRSAVYRIGSTGSLVIKVAEEEGFIQPGVAHPADPSKAKPSPTTDTQPPPPETDLYIHERVAGWSGWSLSVKRPGIDLNRHPDPALATTPDPTVNQPITPFKMTTEFAVAPGSLPELRFGNGYRVRARAVDLAGNSVPLKTATPDLFALPANGVELPYMRFEPVSPPLVVLQRQPTVGGSLEHMVIRSQNANQSLDLVLTTDSDGRHIAPPRISARMAEEHGLLDDSHGKLNGDANTYNMIVARDKYEFPTQDGVPLEPGASIPVSYLPDPFARGAAFVDLPNTPSDTAGRLKAGHLQYVTLPDVQPSPGSVTYIDFGADWPARQAFRLVIAEGNAAPAWDAAQRLLTVSLPKAAVADINLSSYLSEDDLTVMGVWNWLREYFEFSELNAITGGVASLTLSMTSDTIALMTRMVLQGGHEMITPARTLRLVHAVQQPLGRPSFVQLPVVHQPAAPIFASALRNSFTPITAWRSVGSHTATLLGALRINALSSSKIELQGRWREVTDDPSLPAPTRAWHSDHVETIPLATAAAGSIYSDATNIRAVAVYIPKVDTLWFAAPFDELDGVMTPSAVAAPLHRFDDTKHRWVIYKPVATTRFQEYFAPNLDFTRSGDNLAVDVPSSARPVTPDIAYVIPTFGWEQQETTNVKSSVRFGNGLRVYLHRPWYSSGDNELLGVVCWSGSYPDADAREKYKPYFTQWGNDPIWQAGFMSAAPGPSDLSNAVTTATQLTLEETSLTVDVAGLEVTFDQERGLWFCDIEFHNLNSYAPFVRLALARYQPHSVNGVELSRVALADYAQLTPNRSAVISIDPADSRKARVFVGGLAPQTPQAPIIVVTVERRIPNVLTDLGWEEAPLNAVHVTEDAPPPTDPSAVLWSGNISFTKVPPAGQFRVVIREYERIQVDSPPGELVIGERLVYAAIIPYDYPSSTPKP